VSSQVIAARLEQAAALRAPFFVALRNGLTLGAPVQLNREASALRALLGVREYERPAVLTGPLNILLHEISYRHRAKDAKEDRIHHRAQRPRERHLELTNGMGTGQG
jgi:hypothetical protein